MNIAFIVGVFVAGGAIGALGLFLWSAWYFTQPKNALELLRGIVEQRSKVVCDHWLEVSADDSTRTCPCCGWTGKALP